LSRDCLKFVYNSRKRTDNKNRFKEIIGLNQIDRLIWQIRLFLLSVHDISFEFLLWKSYGFANLGKLWV